MKNVRILTSWPLSETQLPSLMLSCLGFHLMCASLYLQNWKKETVCYEAGWMVEIKILWRKMSTKKQKGKDRGISTGDNRGQGQVLKEKDKDKKARRDVIYFSKLILKKKELFILPLRRRATLGSLCTGLMSNSTSVCLPHSGLAWLICRIKLFHAWLCKLKENSSWKLFSPFNRSYLKNQFPFGP